MSFNQNWAAYRDGFGSAAGNDNYWLGLDKVYRLVQMGGVRLRVEVLKFTQNLSCQLLLKNYTTNTVSMCVEDLTRCHGS